MEDDDILIIDDYPEIALILWDWNIPYISEKDLFGILNRRTKYLYQDFLSQNELSLIQKLCDKFNDGESVLG